MEAADARAVFHNFVAPEDPILPLLNHSRNAFDDFVKKVTTDPASPAPRDVSLLRCTEVACHETWTLPVLEIMALKFSVLREMLFGVHSAALDFFWEQCPMVCRRHLSARASNASCDMSPRLVCLLQGHVYVFRSMVVDRGHGNISVPILDAASFTSRLSDSTLESLSQQSTLALFSLAGRRVNLTDASSHSLSYYARRVAALHDDALLGVRAVAASNALQLAPGTFMLPCDIGGLTIHARFPDNLTTRLITLVMLRALKPGDTFDEGVVVKVFLTGHGLASCVRGVYASDMDFALENDLHAECTPTSIPGTSCLEFFLEMRVRCTDSGVFVGSAEVLLRSFFGDSIGPRRVPINVRLWLPPSRARALLSPMDLVYVSASCWLFGRALPGAPFGVAAPRGLAHAAVAVHPGPAGVAAAARPAAAAPAALVDADAAPVDDPARLARDSTPSLAAAVYHKLMSGLPLELRGDDGRPLPPQRGFFEHVLARLGATRVAAQAVLPAVGAGGIAVGVEILVAHLVIPHAIIVSGSVFLLGAAATIGSAIFGGRQAASADSERVRQTAVTASMMRTDELLARFVTAQMRLQLVSTAIEHKVDEFLIAVDDDTAVIDRIVTEASQLALEHEPTQPHGAEGAAVEADPWDRRSLTPRLLATKVATERDLWSHMKAVGPLRDPLNNNFVPVVPLADADYDSELSRINGILGAHERGAAAAGEARPPLLDRPVGRAHVVARGWIVHRNGVAQEWRYLYVLRCLAGEELGVGLTDTPRGVVDFVWARADDIRFDLPAGSVAVEPPSALVEDAQHPDDFPRDLQWLTLHFPAAGADGAEPRTMTLGAGCAHVSWLAQELLVAGLKYQGYPFCLIGNRLRPVLRDPNVTRRLLERLERAHLAALDELVGIEALPLAADDAEEGNAAIRRHQLTQVLNAASELRTDICESTLSGCLFVYVCLYRIGSRVLRALNVSEAAQAPARAAAAEPEPLTSVAT